MPPVPDAVRDHLALALVPGLGPKLTAALLARFGSASAARLATAAQLRTIPHIGDKTASEMAAALRTVDIRRELELIEAFQVTPIPLGSPGYPPPLVPLATAPPLLYLRGAWTEADANAVGIVGSRSCTGYGKRVAAEIARGLARAGAFTWDQTVAQTLAVYRHVLGLDVGEIESSVPTPRLEARR